MERVPPRCENTEVSTTADQERRFYDDQYSRFLDLPDHALAIDRAILLRTIHDPRQPAFERRRLYTLALDRLTKEPLAHIRALEYGCGTADWGLWMASEGAEVALVDLSPVAIEVALRRARAGGVVQRVGGFARDAADLSCFESAHFDLVLASAALHHTLKYPGAYRELLRVLKPGGRLYLIETYGNNPVLNAARRLRAWMARESADQGEGIILGDADLALLRRDFTRVELVPVNLLAMTKRLFRGRFTNPAIRVAVAALEALDRTLLALAPSLRKYCGELLVIATK